jgi:hypothetical protein
VFLIVRTTHASVASMLCDLLLCAVIYSSEGNSYLFTALTDHSLQKVHCNFGIVCGNNKFVLQQVLKRYYV